MNKFLIAFVVLSITPQSALGQVRRVVKGKVSAFANNLQGVYVINLQSGKDVLTEENGYFSIPVTPGDTLVFSSIRFKARKWAVAADDPDKGLLVVRLEPTMQQLDEVRVMQYKNINAEALGIIPKGQKKYTPAGRKLRTATGYDAQIGLNTTATLDPVFNLLSGRTAELRKNIGVEHKERLLDKLDAWYEPAYFVEKLGLPEYHVKGFQFYIVENPSFAKAMNNHNKTMATFLMGELAVKYKEILACEDQ